MKSTWAAVGAAIAVTLGAGGIGISHATTSSGEKPVYLPIEPCRLMDTRAEFQVGPRSTPIGTNETHTLSGQGAVGNCNLPAESTALSLNVTAINATAPTFVSLFPAGGPLPVASHLNPLPGQGPVPNAVNVDLNGGGQFSIYNLQGNVDIIVDVVGIYDDHTHDDRYYTKRQVDEMTPVLANREELIALPVSATEVYTVTCEPGESAVSGGWALVAGAFFSGDVLVTQSFRGGWGSSFDGSAWAFEIANFSASEGQYALQIQCITTTDVPDRLTQSIDTWRSPTRTQMGP